ncbi:hypothetical protein [Echinicola rosea]|uniref:Outer membrane protein beta-barrel domain-containing protein n=1 Tax=Echinicola rosea TaxID=1807691 RepID=A0ABQ1VCB7_9BACT|nr:hypothetical protein [Echinicola rosea]GGF50759.1 hypothetical protein GCM10011339_44120 [Echinicola rosea]
MKVFVFVPLLLLFSLSYAQESNTLMFRVGMGTYSMKSQKLFQQDFMKNSPIPYAKTHTFPPFATFGSALGFNVSKHASIGLWVEYTSTGGRLHYQDYSGHALMDQVLKSFQIGPFMQYRINKSVEWPIYLTLHSSVASISEEMTSEFEIEDNFESENYKLKGINYGLRPGIIIAHEVKPFIIQFGLGGEIQFHGDMKVVSDNDITFRTSDGNNLASQWDGLRMTLGIGFKL